MLPPVIRAKVAFTDSELLSLPVSRAAATSWLSSTAHWTVPSGPSSEVAISKLSLGALRRYWHVDHSVISNSPGPPLVVAHSLRLRPFFWRLFWSLPMVSKAFTPWWRLLHDKIGHRSRLHTWSPAKFPSPCCALRGDSEDMFHFVVGCHYKSSFWRQALGFLSLGADFPTDMDVWSVMVSLCDFDCKPVSADVLSIFGYIFYTLWAAHWRCVIQGDTWSSTWVFNSFKADNTFVINTFFASRSSEDSTSLSLLE
jgi:hypothetical protein